MNKPGRPGFIWISLDCGCCLRHSFSSCVQTTDVHHTRTRCRASPRVASVLSGRTQAWSGYYLKHGGQKLARTVQLVSLLAEGPHMISLLLHAFSVTVIFLPVTRCYLLPRLQVAKEASMLFVAEIMGRTLKMNDCFGD